MKGTDEVFRRSRQKKNAVLAAHGFAFEMSVSASRGDSKAADAFFMRQAIPIVRCATSLGIETGSASYSWFTTANHIRDS